MACVEAESVHYFGFADQLFVLFFLFILIWDSEKVTNASVVDVKQHVCYVLPVYMFEHLSVAAK